MPLVTRPDLLESLPDPLFQSRLNLYGAEPEKAESGLQLVLASLRALRWSYHTKHWMVSGGHFYGDHLLFERLYDGKPDLDDQADALAEKMVALLGPASVSTRQIWPLAGLALEYGAAAGDCPYRQSLAMEEQIQKHLSEAYGTLKSEGRLSLGMDDLLMSIANEREQAIYLIKQRLAPPPVFIQQQS